MLAEIVIKGSPKTESAPLSAVLLDYFERRTDAKVTAKHARAAGRLFLSCWGNTIRVGEITETTQKKFVDWSAEKGHALGTISRNLAVLSAALHFSNLDSKIIVGKTAILDKFDPTVNPGRDTFIPSDEELSQLLDLNMPDGVFRWCLVALLTGARPSAVIDVTPAARQREASVIDLLPEGQTQNKKIRPTIRVSRILGSWLDVWEEAIETSGRLTYTGYDRIKPVQSWMKKARKKIDLPHICPYSFRHKVVTVLRRERIGEDEISRFIGHSRGASRTTLGYGEWSPDYMANVTAALDAWIMRLQTGTKRDLLPPLGVNEEAFQNATNSQESLTARVMKLRAV